MEVSGKENGGVAWRVGENLEEGGWRRLGVLGEAEKGLGSLMKAMCECKKVKTWMVP